MKKFRKITGLICEFNPLHGGHRLILEHAAALSCPVVCVLSGNFVQRGEPAILDKWSRTRLALENGANLVIELPLPWAMAGAERFAAGAVHLLSALGLEGNLIFGSEAGSTAPLVKIAQALYEPAFSAELSKHLRKGISFAQAREHAVTKLLGAQFGMILRSPNNILAIEYIKALHKSSSRLSPHTIFRQGAGHDSPAEETQLRCAQQLRSLIYAGEPILPPYVPESTAKLLQQLREAGLCPASAQKLEPAILAKLRTMEPPAFAALPDISEGLENRMFQAVRTACSLQEVYAGIKSKRYSHARIRRLVYSAFLGLTADLPALPPYLRILGMDKAGEDVLKNAQQTLPFALRASDFSAMGKAAQHIFALEAQADDLYALSLPAIQPCGADFTVPLVKRQ